MSQSRTMSLVESVTNLLLGYVVAVALQMVVFPLFDMRPRFTENLMLAAIFMVSSLIRSYGVRRFFDYRDGRWARG